MNGRRTGNRSDSVPRLKSVELELTKACNLRCVHCYAGAGKTDENELSGGELLDLVGQLANVGVREVTVTGGEPLIKKNALQVIERIDEEGMSVLINTNGMLVTPEVTAFLSRLNVKEVQISIDGATRKTHDGIRRAPSFDKAIHAVGLCLDEGLPVRVNCVLVSLNRDEVIPLAQKVKKMGVMKFSVDLFIPTGRANKSLEVSPMDYAELMKKLGGIGRIKEEPGVRPRCGCAWSRIAIKSNGDVVPCVAMQNMVAGNVREKPVKQIFEGSPVLEETRKATVKNIPECRHCSARHVCRGGCRARALAATGTLMAPDAVHCVLYKRGFRLGG